MSIMYERFTDRARKVMQLAQQEAQRFNHEYVGTEHILLGLIKEGSGVAANVLKNLDMDLHKVRQEVEKIVQAGPDTVTMSKLPQTPRAKKVIEYSIEEARGLNHNYIGTEHLLLGLVREGEGVASQVLTNLGLSLETVREEILALLGQHKDDGSPERKLVEQVEEILKTNVGAREILDKVRKVVKDDKKNDAAQVCDIVEAIIHSGMEPRKILEEVQKTVNEFLDDDDGNDGLNSIDVDIDNQY